MRRNRRWLVVAPLGILCGATLSVIPAHAALPQGTITTFAGSVGTGTATAIGQVPVSLAVTSTDVYVGDGANPVLRDVHRSTGQETALAGNNGYGYSGDGGPATAAMIYGAGAIAVCGGVTYFADTFNYVIRAVDGAGNITTIAGTGTPGFSGDGGPATSAQIGRVFGLACEVGGPGLFLTDSDNGRVRLILNGVINTQWSGFGFPVGITLDPAANMYVSDPGQEVIFRLDGITHAASVLAGTGMAGYSGDNGPGNAAMVDNPRGLTVAPSATHPSTGCGCNVYFADTNNNVIRMVDPLGTISTVLLALNSPIAVAADPAANVMFVADTNHFFVEQAPLAGFSTTGFAGNGTPSWSGDGGQATSAQLGNPFAVAFDGAGNLFVADNQNSVIRKVTPGGVISTVAGSPGKVGFAGDGSQATLAWLNDPRGVVINAAGDIFIADSGNQRVRKVDHTTGFISTVAGTGATGFSGDNGPATSATLNQPRGLAIDSAGNLYIADSLNHRIRVVNTIGTITTFAGTGVAGYNGDGIAATTAQLNRPTSLTFDPSGNLFFTDLTNSRVRKITPGSPNNNIVSTIAGTGVSGLSGDGGPATNANLMHPFGIARDSAGNFYISDSAAQRIRLIDTSGNISSVVGICGMKSGFYGDGGPASIALLNTPLGVAVDGSGNLFIADVNNNRVRETTGLTGLRGASCQGQPAGAAGRQGVNQSPSTNPPGHRIDYLGRGNFAPSSLPAGMSVPVAAPAALPAAPSVARAPHAALPAAPAQQHASGAPQSALPETAARQRVEMDQPALVTVESLTGDSTSARVVPSPVKSVSYPPAWTPLAPLVVLVALVWRIKSRRRVHACKRP